MGTLVNRFNHGLSCSLKLVQLVTHFEHMSSTCAHGLALMVTSYRTNNVVSEVVREIANSDMGAVSSSARYYCQFLTELTDLVPNALVPSLPLIYNFLDNDSYCTRNCALSMMKSIVLKALSRENLDEKSRDVRDSCLDCLEEHMHDVNAFVRSKVRNIMFD